MGTLDKKIEELKALRESLEAGKTVAAEMYEALKTVPAFIDYEDTKAHNKEVDAAITQLENEIRAEAVAVYKAGVKQPHEKVKIENHTIVKPYNEANAREWCFTNFRPALTLDTKTFEKAAKDGQIPSNIVETDTEPRAKISSKL